MNQEATVAPPTPQHIRWQRYGIALTQLASGLTFVVSGLTKANDPRGMLLLLENYIAASHISHDVISENVLFGMVALLAMTEITLGAHLLIGAGKRASAWAMQMFMWPMTIITLWSYATGAVNECGCFGSALNLSPGASLAKNIVLLTMSGLLCYKSNLMHRLPWNASRLLITVISLVLAFATCLYTWQTLPLVDFTPYREGTNIMDGMMGEYEVRNNQSIEVKAPTIHDFAVFDDRGNDVTDDILTATDTITLICVPSTKSSDTGASDRLNTIWDTAHDKGQQVFLIMGEGPEQAEIFKDRTGLICPTLYAGQEMLQTIVRANPGLVQLYQGTILHKDNISNHIFHN